MTKLNLLLALTLSFSVTACAQKPLVEMTSEDWQEDLAYLNKKIQKDFNSFIPNIKEGFDSAVGDLDEEIKELENYEISCRIMKLLSTLQDGHTELNIGQKSVGFHRVPISLYFFSNQLYVLAAHDNYSELVGSKVVNIGDFPMEQVFEKLKLTMSRDNDMEYLHAGPGYIILTELLSCLGFNKNPMDATFTFELNNTTIKRTFKGLDLASYNKGPWKTLFEKNAVEAPLYLSHRQSYYWYDYLSESETMYFNFTRINRQKGEVSIKKFISQMFDEIDQVRPEKLVIDFRLNNGGNYHLSRPLVDAIKSRKWLNQKGKVWVISGRRTFSAASVACIYLKKETEAIIIGEPGRTHPNWSDNNEYMTLPNSEFLIEYTTKIKAHWPEKPNLDRVPVDVEVPPSFESYGQGKDPVMNYILGQIKY